jgi:hypothetical protein
MNFDLRVMFDFHVVVHMIPFVFVYIFRRLLSIRWLSLVRLPTQPTFKSNQYA